MSITVSLKQDDKSIDFDIPTEWKDMTLKYWTELSSIIRKHQKGVELKKNSITDQYSEDENLDNIVKDVEFLHEMHLNRDIFCYLSGLEKDDMHLVDMNKVTEVINTLGVLTEEYEPKGLKSFEFEGETYYFPSEFLKKNTYGDFIESTQLEMSIENMKNGRYDVLPEQMAILCRRIDETYDEDLIDEKTEKFKGLTMDVVFEFAFFLTNQNQNLLKLSSMYLEKKGNL